MHKPCHSRMRYDNEYWLKTYNSIRTFVTIGFHIHEDRPVSCILWCMTMWYHIKQDPSQLLTCMVFNIDVIFAQISSPIKGLFFSFIKPIKIINPFVKYFKRTLFSLLSFKWKMRNFMLYHLTKIKMHLTGLPSNVGIKVELIHDKTSGVSKRLKWIYIYTLTGLLYTTDDLYLISN